MTRRSGRRGLAWMSGHVGDRIGLLAAVEMMVDQHGKDGDGWRELMTLNRRLGVEVAASMPLPCRGDGQGGVGGS